MSRNIPMPDWAGVKFCITGDSIDADWTKYSTIGGYNAGWTLIKNTAVGGRTTEQMLAGFDSELGSVDFDILLIKGGTNDMGAFAQSVTISNLKGIVDKCVALGKKAIVILPPTRNDNIEVSASLRSAIFMYFTKWGVPCLDPFSTCIEPTTGGFKSGYTLDGVHPTTLAHGIAGEKLKEQLLSLITNNSSWKPLANIKAGGILSNPLMLLDSNADGWSDDYSDSSAAFTPTISTDSDFIGGKCQQVVIWPSSADTYIRFLTSSFPSGASKIHFHMKLKLVSFDDSYLVSVHLQSVTGGFKTVLGAAITDQTIEVSSLVDVDTTDSFYYVYFEIKKNNVATYSGTMKFGELQVTTVYL